MCAACVAERCKLGYHLGGGPFSAQRESQGDVCAPRDVTKLSGAKVARTVRKSEVASTTEKVDETLAAAPL